MCVVSLVMDHFNDKWQERLGQYQPSQYQSPQTFLQPAPTISAEEIAEFRRLLERAREYDKRNNEPDCELTEKREALKAVAEKLGIEIAFL